MTEAILNRVEEWNLRDYPIETQAMWLASDYFRKMGVMEVREVWPEVKKRYPEMAAYLQATYPDRVHE